MRKLNRPITDEDLKDKGFPFECTNCGNKPKPETVVFCLGKCEVCGDSIIAYTVDTAEYICRVMAKIEPGTEPKKESTESRMEGSNMNEYACVYAIRFNDDGPHEMGILHEGTEKECEDVSSTMNVITYNGTRPVKDSIVGIMPILHLGELYAREDAT